MKKQRWLVELAGDGSHDSFIVDGDIKKLIKVVNKEMCDDFSEEILDKNDDYWDMYGVLNIELEQAYLRIIPIRRLK